MFTSSGVALPQKKRSLRNRRLVVVDIENVAGGGVVTREVADWAREVVESALNIVQGEQVIIGTSHVGLFNTKYAWPSARVKYRSGRDGADQELIEVLTSERVEERFDEVALVSGDGAFTDIVAHLGRYGVKVTVASWSTSLAVSLRLAARRVVYLDDWSGRPAVEEVA